MSTPIRGGGWQYPTIGMLLVQTVTSMCIMAPAILAPVAATDFALTATAIGMFTAIVYLAAMLSGTLSNDWMSRVGPVQLACVGILATAAGLVMFSFGSVGIAVFAALLMGMTYGPVNPVSAYTLNLVSPPRWRPLIFSVKQTGVVIGGAITGALVPTLIVSFGWEQAARIIAIAGALSVVLVWPLRHRFPRPAAGSSSGLRSGLASLSMVLRDPLLRGYSFAAVGYSGVQVSVAVFLVLYLHRELSVDLVTAGLLFSVNQVTGVFGRLFWGAVSDNIIRAPHVLFVISLLSAASVFALYIMEPGVPIWVIALVCFLSGFSSFGWNGVLIAEVTRYVGGSSVGAAIGGIQFFFFGGVFIIPPTVGLIAEAFGFRTAFLGMIVVSVVAGVGVLLAARRAGG